MCILATTLKAYGLNAVFLFIYFCNQEAEVDVCTYIMVRVN